MSDRPSTAAEAPTTAAAPAALRAATFAQLVAEVQACRRCPRMEGRVRVLGPANGSPDARVLMIAEAPGRLGADRSAIPLHGDQTGRLFEALLDHAGLARQDLFITNAVLCNPRNAHGRNAPPAERELAHCVDHLRATLTLLDPAVVVTLGVVVLRALGRLARHDLVLARAIGVPQPWFGRLLVPLYHLGPRARLHRSLEQQRQDYARLGHLLRMLGLVPASDQPAQEHP